MKKYLKFLQKSLYALVLIVCFSLEGATVIHAGSLLDGTGSEPVKRNEHRN